MNTPNVSLQSVHEPKINALDAKVQAFWTIMFSLGLVHIFSGHIYYLTYSEKSGFEILEVKYITAPMDVLPEGWFKTLMTTTLFRNDTTWLPILSTSIFVVAKKRPQD